MEYKKQLIQLLRRIITDEMGGAIPSIIAEGVMQVCPQEANRVKKEIEYMQKLNINTYG